jgi:hypothetical protein
MHNLAEGVLGAIGRGICTSFFICIIHDEIKKDVESTENARDFAAALQSYRETFVHKLDQGQGKRQKNWLPLCIFVSCTFFSSGWDAFDILVTRCEGTG